MTEKQILFEKGDFWVCRDKGAYVVFKNGVTHSTSVAAFRCDKDGLGLAKAYAIYLAKWKGK